MRLSFALLLLLKDAGAPAPAFDPAHCGVLRTIAPLGAELSGIAFSPDGRLLAVGAGTGIRLYETAGWREAGKLEGHPNMILSVAWSPDGKTLAAGGFEGTVVEWNAAMGERKKTWAAHASYVGALAWSPDGKALLTGSLDGTARVWDMRSGTELKALPVRGVQTVAAAFSPDGRRAATSGANGQIRIWKAEAWEEETALTGGRNENTAIAFSADGRWLASGGGGDVAVRLWNLDRGRVDRELRGHAGHVAAARFTRDGRYVVSAGDTTVRVWELSTGRELAQMAHHTGGLTGLALHPGGRLFATIGQDRHLKVWGHVPGGMARVRGKGFCGIRVQQTAVGIVAVSEVIPNTAAQQAGLQAGDLLRKVGGVAIANSTESVDKIGSYSEGDEVEFEVDRAGQTRVFKIKLGKRPQDLDR